MNVDSTLSRSYSAGTVLFHEHDPGSRMYVVKAGRVRVWRRLGDHEIVLAHIGEGEFFGEMALLEGLPRSATATVAIDSELVEIDKETFEAMLKANSEIAVRMMRKLCSRLREADRRLQTALIEHGLGRVIEALRSVSSGGEPVKSGGWVRLSTAQGAVDFYARAGIPVADRKDVETRLERAKILRRYDGDVFIADEKTLDAFSDYLHLHNIYHPLISREFADVQNLPQDDVRRLVKRMLIEKMATEQGIVADPVSDRVAEQYDRYVRLQERFGQP
jgi:CRP/FNR family cyclic AMP-dependent transcriptional regulator